jgi:hypothetical protein
VTAQIHTSIKTTAQQTLTSPGSGIRFNFISSLLFLDHNRVVFLFLGNCPETFSLVCKKYIDRCKESPTDNRYYLKWKNSDFFPPEKPSRGQVVKHLDGYITVISERQRVNGEPESLQQSV